ncbi:hypothetical protein [Bradyrhizobium sp.]|uniref:hypothetical protein n=1 Tax=Bradyrhizobium sp. TaxID=376 RepID=UPI002D24B2A1|nr:hypothetical protein [Bradyrhizobium sp.]HZR77357.1 hypothetical protein [Bradyrhizobium sp.]
MKMPLSFTPEFIGGLIAKRDSLKNDTPRWERLNIAIGQCRTYNKVEHDHRNRLWPLMIRTQQELASLGVVVG